MGAKKKYPLLAVKRLVFAMKTRSAQINEPRGHRNFFKRTLLGKTGSNRKESIKNLAITSQKES